MIGNCIVNISLVFGHTQAAKWIKRIAGSVKADPEVSIGIDSGDPADFVQNRLHVVGPLAMSLLQILHRLLVAIDAHVVAHGEAANFDERARADSPPVVGALVLHSDVAFVGDAVNAADLSDEVGHLLVPAAVALLHRFELVHAQVHFHLVAHREHQA